MDNKPIEQLTKAIVKKHKSEDIVIGRKFTPDKAYEAGIKRALSLSQTDMILMLRQTGGKKNG